MDKDDTIKQVVDAWMDKYNFRWEGTEETGWAGSAVLEAMLLTLVDDTLSALEAEGHIEDLSG